MAWENVASETRTGARATALMRRVSTMLDPQALAATLLLYPNAALREKPGQARLAVGGPAHGTIIASEEYTLEAVTERGTTFRYDSVEIGVWNRVYRTWRWPGMLHEEHVAWAVLALIDLSPDMVKKVLVDLDSAKKKQAERLDSINQN